MLKKSEDGVYVRMSEGGVRFFKNMRMRISTNGVLCVGTGGDHSFFTKLVHAFPEGTWKEASTEPLCGEI